MRTCLKSDLEPIGSAVEAMKRNIHTGGTGVSFLYVNVLDGLVKSSLVEHVLGVPRRTAGFKLEMFALDKCPFSRAPCRRLGLP